MKLIYHPLSPFSRMVYMTALELSPSLADSIVLEKVVVAPIHIPGWSDNNADVARFNPIAKIPTLVTDDGDGLFDSRVIMDYLVSRAPQTSSLTLSGNGKDADRRFWRSRTAHACAMGMLDAEVLVIYENRIRGERNLKFQTWIDGQREKIMRGFDRLEREVRDGTLRFPGDKEGIGIAEIAVAATVGFFDIVKLNWREGGSRPRLEEWFDVWKQRDSFVKTPPEGGWQKGAEEKLSSKSQGTNGTDV